MVVGVSYPSSVSVTGVAYAGAPMWQIGGAADPTDSTRMGLWFLLAPASGPNIVSVNFSGPAGAVAGASSWTGVDQTTPLGSFTSARGQSAAPMVIARSSLDEVIVDAVANIGTGGPPAAGPGQSQLWSGLQGGIGGGGSYANGRNSVSMSWSQTVDVWAIGAVPLKPAR